MITVSEEKSVDYELTARIAAEAFGSKGGNFSAERMRWLYERSFGEGSAILAVFDEGIKVGQIGLIHQRICSNGKSGSAVQLVDHFILQPYRSAQLVRRIYKEVERLCLDKNIRFIVALPNENATQLNARFLKLKPLVWLQIRAGVALLPPGRSKLKYSANLKSMTRDQAVNLLSSFSTAATDNGVSWNGETLFERMNDPTCDYALHATDDLLLISSSRETRGIKYALLCGFFVRSQIKATPSAVRELIRAACQFWKHLFFVYAGINTSLSRLPGVALPARLRKPVLVQLRDFTTDEPTVRFDRFQLINSDFV